MTHMISVNKILNSEHDLLSDIFTVLDLHWVYWHCFGSRVWWILHVLNSCYWSMLGWLHFLTVAMRGQPANLLDVLNWQFLEITSALGY